MGQFGTKIRRLSLPFKCDLNPLRQMGPQQVLSCTFGLKFVIAPIEEHRAHAYETKFAMLISTSVIQVVPDHITLINFEFSHPYSYYNVKLFLFHACRCVQMFISSIHEIEKMEEPLIKSGCRCIRLHAISDSREIIMSTQKLCHRELDESIFQLK